MPIDHGDGLPDDRVTCSTCTNYRAPYHCTRLKQSVIPHLPLRCERYHPDRAQADSRDGRARWPGMREAITAARDLDDAFGARR